MESLRDEDRTIRLLIIFHDRQPGAADGEARTVQCMDEFAFSALGFETDTGAAGLK